MMRLDASTDGDGSATDTSSTDDAVSERGSRGTPLREALGSVVVDALRWPARAYGNVRDDGVAGVSRTKSETVRRWVSLASKGYVRFVDNPGESIWEREWDVLLVLDACRVDLLCEVAAECPLLDDSESVGSLRSVASKSDDWMRRTFGEPHADDVQRTAYVSGNPHTARVDFPVEPQVLDEVWRYAWDEDLRTVPARPVTDRAIETWRDREELGVDRMVVHYMQPHAPFVSHPDLDPGNDLDGFLAGRADVWARLAEGGGPSLERVWRAYRDNLRYVLDDAALLCSNIDADRVAVSADHGNAVGEWDVWGHPGDVLVPAVRRVPWAVTSARDTGAYRPSTERKDRVADANASEDGGSVEARLQALGYTE